MGEVDWQSVELSSDIELANTIDMLVIFNHYDLRLDKHNKKVCCPLPHHNERTPSFNYNPTTNSFFCFGCKHGGGPVELVALMNGCAKIDAARHILSQFSAEVRVEDVSSRGDFAERQKILIGFSTVIRTYIHKHMDKEGFDKADKITFIFDELNNRNNISNEGLVQLIEKLEKRLLNA